MGSLSHGGPQVIIQAVDHCKQGNTHWTVAWSTSLEDGNFSATTMVKKLGLTTRHGGCSQPNMGGNHPTMVSKMVTKMVRWWLDHLLKGSDITWFIGHLDTPWTRNPIINQYKPTSIDWNSPVACVRKNSGYGGYVKNFVLNNQY